ncbi:MAG: recombination mediator RecR [Patescibacteria group bacterium]
MTDYPEQIKQAIASLARLPGLGPKSAERLVFYLVKNGSGPIDTLVTQLTRIRSEIRVCDQCGNIAVQNPCHICNDSARDTTLLCIVAEPQDITIIDKSGDFRGRYHVLGGVIDPADNMTPDKLRIASLIDRIKNSTPPIREVIIATNPDLEGESTAMYLHRQLRSLPITISRLAKGLPMGATIEYADEVTISNALKGRQKM